MIIIGEKINGSIPSVAEAIAKRDAEFIKQRARIQDEAGATFIDCCASVPEAEEVETLKWMIDCIQQVSDLPISIDSPSARVLAEAYKFCKRPGLFNSVSGEGDKIDVIFPIMAENKGWECIALCSDDTGIPRSETELNGFPANACFGIIQNIPQWMRSPLFLSRISPIRAHTAFTPITVTRILTL